MDDQFDRLSRAMAGSLPRRRTLKLMAATAAGMGAAMLGLRPASAHDDHEGEPCKCVESTDQFTGEKKVVCTDGYGGCDHKDCSCEGKAVGDVCGPC